MLFIRDTAKNSVAYQLTQPVRETMRCEPQILLNRLKPADAAEYIAEDQHGPPVAYHRQGSRERACHRVDLLPTHIASTFAQQLA